jgi:hypothetical protein
MDSAVQLEMSTRKDRPWILIGHGLLLSIFIAISIRHAALSELGTPLAVPVTLTIWQNFLMITALILVLFFMTRLLRFSGFLSALFAVALFLGAWVYCWSVLPWEMALLVASAITILQARIRRVFVHNLFVLIGTAGVVIHFSFMFPDRSLLMIFVGLLIYDMVVGRPNGSVAKMASAIVHRGVIPGLIIPDRVKGLMLPIRISIQEAGSIFLGSGDLIIPMVLVARSAMFGWWQVIIVTIGTLIGYSVLGFRKSLKPFPALIPIGLGAGIPYFVIAFFR